MANGDLPRSRIYAWLIDLLLAAGLGAILWPVGWLASTGYWLVRDALFKGQSVGKRLIGLKVVSTDQSRSIWLTSVIRNVLWAVPLINLVTGLTGLYYLFHEPDGRHWGDRLADTRVIRA